MRRDKDYYFERLSEDNFDQFVKMYNTVFKKNVAAEVLQKKYDARHIIHGYWAFMAFDIVSKQAVASYGVVPWLFKCQDENIMAAQSVDTMTVEGHRGKGLFGVLHQMTAELLKENGFKFIFGFPNQNSYPIFRHKLNWKFYGHLNLYRINTGKKIPIRKICCKILPLKWAHNRVIDNILKKNEVAGFIPNSIDKTCVETFKNKHFFQKKLSKAHKIIHLGGSFFLVKITNRMILGDVNFESEATFQKDIEMLVKLAFKLGITSIDFLCSQNKNADRIFTKYFKEEVSLPIGIFELNKSDVEYKNLKFTTVDLDIF